MNVSPQQHRHSLSTGQRPLHLQHLRSHHNLSGSPPTPLHSPDSSKSEPLSLKRETDDPPVNRPEVPAATSKLSGRRSVASDDSDISTQKRTVTTSPATTESFSEIDEQQQQSKKRRGNLPKPVTDVLRNWLIQHIQHPYPTETEKLELMQQTGLSLNQISNWFINARRRRVPSMTKEEGRA
jgi:hypothetical protein